MIKILILRRLVVKMLTQTKYIHRRGLGKSVAHEEIQGYLKKQIPALELEKNLGRRRADAVWEERKVVFEIQISPISLQEALQRCTDYASMGYQVVWVLHEALYNGPKVSPAEKFLRAGYPTYFTNGAALYDQIEVIRGRKRLFKGEPLPVNIAEPCAPFIKVPDRNWPLHFVGDAHTACATLGVQEIQKIIHHHAPPEGWKWWLHFIGLRILELVSTNQK
jgi:hypothetical protein